MSDDQWGIHLASVAAKDPALAAIVAHQHDCIESLKSTAQSMRADLAELKSDGKTTRNSAIATLLTALAFVAWFVVTHPHGF